MTNFNERTNKVLYKKYNLSHFILERVMLLVCERWVGDGDRLVHIDPSSSDHSSTSFSSWLGLLNRGSLRAQSPLSAADSQFGILSPTDSNWLEPPRAPCYIIVWRSFASAVLPLFYTGGSLDWRLGRCSICYNHPILIYQNSTCGIFLHVCLHPPHTHILQIITTVKIQKRNYLNHSNPRKKS